MTIKSTKAMVQSASIPEDLGFWRSKLLWASRVLPMPLVGLLIIVGVCSDVGSQASEYPAELEALSRLDFGAAMKVFLAKRLATEFTQATADVEEKSVIIGERNRAATEALRRSVDEVVRTIQNLRDAAGEQVTLFEEQKNLAGEQAQMINKLEAAKGKAETLQKQAENLETYCREILETEEVVKMQKKVFKVTWCVIIQLMLLVLVFGMFVL